MVPVKNESLGQKFFVLVLIAITLWFVKGAFEQAAEDDRSGDSPLTQVQPFDRP